MLGLGWPKRITSNGGIFVQKEGKSDISDTQVATFEYPDFDVVAPFCDAGRCEVIGPDVRIVPQTAVTLALALYELATNASKYGALSVDAGKVHVGWTADGDKFDLKWQETGGPAVQAPTSEGFGMRLIRRSLAAELRGKVEIDFGVDGLTCRILGFLG